MTCINPYVLSIGRAYGCGRCRYCRIKKAKEWTHRIILESTLHTDNSFVTLTYSDEHLPEGGTLDPDALKNFLKRLRKAIEPARIRFFAVGEYGDRTSRPHYHLALFGYPSCNASYHRPGHPCRCPPCVGIARAWSTRSGEPIGHIVNGTLEPASAHYIAAYSVKSMREDDKDVRYPDGCIPPFSRMSLKPGIGAGVCDDIASSLLFAGRDDIQDIPSVLQHGRVRRPVGRYLRGKIRERLGLDRNAVAIQNVQKLEYELRPLREMALKAPPHQRSFAFRELYVEQSKVRRLQIETKWKIKQAKGKI